MTLTPLRCDGPWRTATGGGSVQSSKKQREIYVGNLAMNLVTDSIIAEVFNSALAGAYNRSDLSST
jgi:hypothetical protein